MACNRIRCHSLLFFCLLFLLPVGCAINPVTGERELAMVGEDQEIDVGSKQYEPGRQMQGGDYLADPELSAYVDSVGQRLAEVSDRTLPYEFKILNNSVPNAWALPGGKIVVNRGLLLELHNEAELAAVLSHEIVHSAARHGAKGMEKDMLMQGALLATAMTTAQSDYASLAVGGARLAATIITRKYSREAELEADLYGMRYMARAGYDAESAVSLQETFVRLAEGRNEDWLSGLFASHPPSLERVEANRRTAAGLPSGGEKGEKRYLNQTARLRATAPAYKAYDEAVLALRQGDTEKALALADNALRLEPNEGFFYGLKGDVFFTRGDYGKALDEYNRAIAVNDRYFHFYEQRSLTKEKLDDLPGALLDMKKSAGLLPTATAYKKLGDFAQQAGQRAVAKHFFQAAASSPSPAGKEALASFLMLDLPDNPDRYVHISPEKTAAGQASLRVVNATSLTIYDIDLQVRYTDEAGTARKIPLRLAAALQPNAAADVPLDEKSLPARYLPTIQVEVVAARVALPR